MNKKGILSFFSAVILFACLNTLYAEKRSMYLWYVQKDTIPVSHLLNDIGSVRDDLVHFCYNLPGTTDTVDTIYLYMDASTVAAQASLVRGFISEMHLKGIKIFALNGEPDWSQIGSSSATNFSRAIIDYNQDYSPYERFDGIDLDIEVGAGFSSTGLPVVLARCKTIVDNYNSKFNDEMRLSAFIDRQLSYSTRTNVINSVDWTVHEDYKDDTTGNPIIQEVTNYLKFASSKGKNMYIAYETQSTNDWPTIVPGNTFAEEGWRYMEEKIEKAKEVFKRFPAFRGISIHAYHSYKKTLPPQMGHIIINNGEKVTDSPEVKLNLECSYATQMMISEDPFFLSGEWERYTRQKYYTFENTSGIMPLYVKFRDSNSPALESEIYSASIEYRREGSDLSQVKVTPNVVNIAEGSDPHISFRDLTQGTLIKIYNFFEELVYEKYIETGSDFMWDLKNINGRNLPSGTYIYIISNDSGSRKMGKLVIIK
ncbi:MAG: hypothetical protein KKH98_12070 [Spirochaetes bacterium]|nr:hypothetical protein [Spirochaetota bacterium]